MIQGYPTWPSVRPGSPLEFHISTDAPRFRVDFYRQGQRLVHVGSSPWFDGRRFSPGPPDQDWGWPRYVFAVPTSWPSGAYIGMLVEGNESDAVVSAPDTTAADGRDARILFVVRGAAPDDGARVLYKLAWATYHAYNASGGGSVYVNPIRVPHTRFTRVTTRRPGGGTGGALSFPDNTDVYDPATPREGFAHWDVPFIAWLERNGHAVDYCTDLDLHREPDLLDPYTLLLSVGHDEYWSEAMRLHVERFVAGGGNVAFFSANTCWWRIHFVDGETAFVCDHPPYSAAESDQWWRIMPENSLTGVSYRNAGGWWSGPREAVGYTVHHADHWLFEGTGLRDGETFGAEERLVGYECDGALLDPTSPVPRPLGTDGTPAGFVVLGVGRLGPGWQDRPLGNNAAATMGMYTNCGTVFTCGTTDWARVLHMGEPRVTTITSTIMSRLSTRAVRINGPFPTRFGTAVAVAGETASFQVDLGDRPGDAELRFRWTIAGTGGGRYDTPRIEVPMPSDMPLLTATVTVTDGAEYYRFGTTTFRVLSRREGLQFALLGRLRELADLAAPSPTATAELQDGNRPFGDPRWHPVRDGLRRPLGGEVAGDVSRAAEDVRDIAQRLMTLDRSSTDTERGPQSG